MNKFLFRWIPPLYAASVFLRMLWYLWFVDNKGKAKAIIYEHEDWKPSIWKIPRGL